MKLTDAEAHVGLDEPGEVLTPGAVIFRGRIPGEALMLNGMYANVPGVGRVLTGKARAWKKMAAEALRYTCIADARPLTSGARLHLRLTVYGRWESKAGQPLKRDADGTIKAVQDVLAECLGVDDRRIYYIEVQKVHAPPAEARVEIELRALELVRHLQDLPREGR